MMHNYIKSNFRIIVINNSGGGIFRILPGHKNTDNFDIYFETKHHLDSKHLCAMFDIEYTTVDTHQDLKRTLKSFYESSERPKLLEVFTPAKLNDQILLKYFDFIK